MFEKFILRSRVRCGTSLDEEDQMRLFDLPDAKELLRVYLSCWELCDRAKIKLLEQPYAKSLLKEVTFSEKLQLTFFMLSNAEQLVRVYISEHPLCDEAVLKLLSLPDFSELHDFYFKLNSLTTDPF